MSEPLRRFATGVAIGAGGGALSLAWVLLGGGVDSRVPPGDLLFPVPAAVGVDLSGRFDDPRGSRSHAGVDIPAPRGAKVVAAADGVVARLSTGELSGIALELMAADGLHCFFYAHLDGYADDVVEGSRVTRGAPLGYVGTTGNAPEAAPHLHLEVRRLAAGESCWEGDPVDPAPLIGACPTAAGSQVGPADGAF